MQHSDGGTPPGERPQMFMPEDPSSQTGPPPGASGAASIGLHAIRRKVLTGQDETGQPVIFGDTTYAMLEAGMRDGATGLACSSDGVIAIYTSHNESAIDLTGASPSLTQLAREFVASFDVIAPALSLDQPAGWPMPRQARFWLRRHGVLSGISGSAEQLAQALSPFTRTFNLFQAIIQSRETEQAAAPAAAAAVTPSHLRAVALRRNALAGLNDNGEPATPDARLAALVDLGVDGGCTSVAVFHNGAVSLLFQRHGRALDLGLAASQPAVAGPARALTTEISKLPDRLRWDERTDYPLPGEARFYRASGAGYVGTSVPAAAVRDPQVGTAGAFAAAVALLGNHPAELSVVATKFPVGTPGGP